MNGAPKNRSVERNLIALAGAVVLILSHSGTAVAQSAVDAGDQIEEILVTAQKRSERIQDIPISISAISGADLERAGARDIKDVLLSIPGVSYSSSEPGQSRYSIRGVSTAASSPTVGIYLNDISLITVGTGFAGAADPLLVDIERVEVLKGPQGTLYGGSAMGGAIKYVTREPQMNKFAVTAGGGVGYVDHGGVSYNAESFLNIPLLDDRMALRIGGAYRLDAGFVDNVPGGLVQVFSRSATLPPAPFAPVTYNNTGTLARDDWNERRTTVGRASVKWVPIDSLTITPVATIQHSNKANPDDFFTNLPKIQNSVRFAQPTRDNLEVYSLNATQKFGWADLTSLTGYMSRIVEWDRDYSLFIAGLVPALLPNNSYNVSNTNSRTYSQEIRLASADPDAALKWTVGIYYSHQYDNLYQLVDTVGAGVAFGTGTDQTYLGNQTTYTAQKAAFGNVSYAFTKQIEASVGVRWFDIKQRVDGSFDGVFNGGHSEVDAKRSTDVGFTPRYELSYKPLDNNLLYGSASKGFRQGGPNRFNTDSPLCAPDFARLGITRAPASFQPDNLWTYELGSKNELGAKRTVINAAIYYTDWKKIQQQVNLNSCGFQFVGNVGAATIKGAELSIESAVGGGVSLGGNIAYADTRINESAPGVSAQIGQEVLDTPKWTGSAYGDYRFLDRVNWSGSFRADIQYHGKNLRAFEEFQSVRFPDGALGTIPDGTQVQNAYHVINANVNFVNGNLQYRLYLDNIANAEPYLDFRRASGTSDATTIRPRTVGVGIRANF
ncbi:MAG: iron complex outerrane recepter protein [Gammaproteobacteria bacterium]|nr:iron complex outerrane recepter protein [Gammaproteobacteria bacterium]